ncbi:MAG: NAD-dependent epimerase/dehydratase family protein [Bacteroidota bacterium]|nr:NAD-dependent epimerase/dehydratase family protein [Bacteroidota bacterium]
MIIGNGLVAAGFSPYAGREEFLIFASGVSDSKHCSAVDFERERNLLTGALEENPGKRFVYFGTASVADPDLRETPYIRHKIAMEELVRTHAAAFHIFRVSNLAGVSANPNTVLNFLYAHISQGRPFELWTHSERNIIDLADVFQIADHILRKNLFANRTIAIANEKNYAVRYIVKCIEAFTGRTAIYTERAKGSAFQIDISDIQPICRSLGIRFGEDYLPHLLEKYYAGEKKNHPAK